MPRVILSDFDRSTVEIGFYLQHSKLNSVSVSSGKAGATVLDTSI